MNVGKIAYDAYYEEATIIPFEHLGKPQQERWRRTALSVLMCYMFDESDDEMEKGHCNLPDCNLPDAFDCSQKFP